jgi:hypothetical protein
VGELHRDHKWTPSELAAAKEKLFGGLPSEIGKFRLLS